MDWTNLKLADLLERIGDILQLQGENAFKVGAYRRASESISHLNQDVRAIWQNDANNLKTISGVGDAIALKLDELLRTGSLAYYDKISREVPLGVLEIMKVPDVGPKTTLRLWKDLQITTTDELRAAIAAGKVQAMKGMGAKSAAKILAGLDMVARKTGRRRIDQVDPFANDLLASLRGACGQSIQEITFAGSLRRRRSTIGDLDLLACAAGKDHPRILEAFTQLRHVATVNDHGGTKASIIAHNGMQVDLRVIQPKNWGCALVYFTGSKDHNVIIRGMAQQLAHGLRPAHLERQQ